MDKNVVSALCYFPCDQVCLIYGSSHILDCIHSFSSSLRLSLLCLQDCGSRGQEADSWPVWGLPTTLQKPQCWHHNKQHGEDSQRLLKSKYGCHIQVKILIFHIWLKYNFNVCYVGPANTPANDLSAYTPFCFLCKEICLVNNMLCSAQTHMISSPLKFCNTSQLSLSVQL